MNPEETYRRIFAQWTAGKDRKQAAITIYKNVRDLRYAVIPELNDGRRYLEILRCGRGSCTPKHLLLGRMFEQLGYPVLYSVFPFRWNQEDIPYPPAIRKLAKKLAPAFHLACRVDIDGRLVLVDATLDPVLARLGMPVNQSWDGVSETVLPIDPIGQEEIYHPSEAILMRPDDPDDRALEFYRELNLWLDEVRNA
ncbi:MAG: hypothetical protein JXA46_17230 [Dehalococcoidales bacterium]|nr:hypothetical protein [Dehalococcoidales bacterium]